MFWELFGKLLLKGLNLIALATLAPNAVNLSTLNMYVPYDLTASPNTVNGQDSAVQLQHLLHLHD